MDHHHHHHHHYLFANEECSSGCESGWTLYLDHSSIHSPSYNQEPGRRTSTGVFTEAKKLKREDQDQDQEEDEDEEEDLSMVSDASSGPPHFNEEECSAGNDAANGNMNGCFYHYPLHAPSSRNRSKNRDNRRRKLHQHHSSLLDDTASSPFYDFSNTSFTGTRSPHEPSVDNVLEYSQGYSSTQFEVRPPYQEHHYDFFQSSPSANHQLHQNQWFEDKRW